MNGDLDDLLPDVGARSPSTKSATRCADHGYIADERLATTVFLKIRFDKPAADRGPGRGRQDRTGQGDGRLTGRPLVRLQCYEGQDETKALYDWDYGKQLLYTQMLRDKIGEIVSDATDLE